jgi:DMSO/TMAO reductase YedYZ molybdopterin-dependent catalytic subunit
MDDHTIGRAAFLGVVGAGIAGLFYGRDAMRFVGRIVPDTVQAIVPTSGWRIYTIGSSVPHVDPAAYRLTIGGAVDRPVSYSLDDLRALPQSTQVSDFHCVTGWSVDDVHWRGVRFRDLLAEAGPRADAKALRFVSAEEPYDDTLSLPQAFSWDAMLALEMDGKPLTAAHGFPARVVMPRMYGYKNVKWVRRIEVRPHLDDVGYWELRGYDEDAWVGASNGL